MGTVVRLPARVAPLPAPTDADTLAVLRWLDGGPSPALGSAWYQALEQAKAAGLVEGNYVDQGHRVTDAGRAWLAANPTARRLAAEDHLRSCEHAWRAVTLEADELREQLAEVEPRERAAHQAYLDALSACPPARADVPAEMAVWLPGEGA